MLFFMNRGQVSFDFILTLIAVLLFFQLLLGLSSEMQEQQNKIVVRNQLNDFALRVKTGVAACKILDASPEADSASFVFNVPFVKQIGRNDAESRDCSISFDNTNKKIFASNPVNAVSAVIGFDPSTEGEGVSVNGSPLTGAVIRCGDKVAVSC